MNLIIVMTAEHWRQAGAEAQRVIQDPDYAIFHPRLYVLQEKDRQWREALCRQAEDALILCDLPALAGELSQKGLPVVGYLHPGVDGAAFRKVPYILSEIDEIEPDTYEKIFQRLHHLPWTILQTKRCVVREMTVDDLPGIYQLYDDPQAQRFLAGPDPDPAREKEFLAAYIDRVYPLYGYGYWAIVRKADNSDLAKETASCGEGHDLTREIEPNHGEKHTPTKEVMPSHGEKYAPMKEVMPSDGEGYTPTKEIEPSHGGLIGRVGFEPYQGKSKDVSFGYLLRADCRHQGLAQEVCRAVLSYAEQNLCFPGIVAQTDPANQPSKALLRRLGFTFEKIEDKTEIWRYHSRG